jgi:acetylornithine deacetylase/succinyl-diaminopimelate desuccinylase-like protein
MNARDPSLPLQADEVSALGAFAEQVWDEEIIPALKDYIAIPAKSPMFDADWAAHGYIDRVVRDAASWVESKKVPGLKLEVIRLEGRTPVIFFELPATKSGSTDTVLLYGHLDKQPEFNGWRNDLGPWTPKYEDGKLYGRGGADDGYAIYASLTALMALDRQGVPRPRCVGLIETCEESGSFDLPAYVDVLKDRLGTVSLVVCLDSGAGDYDRLWMTTSLRGMVSGVLKVEVLTEGIHSGDSSGWRTPPPAACCRRASTARSPVRAWSRPAPPPPSSRTRSTSACPGPAARTAARCCPSPPIRWRCC